MKMLKLKKALCLLLAVPVLIGAAGCGKSSAPDLSEVEDTFRDLIEASFAVNDIFFGPGLETYDRATSTGDGDAQYDEATGRYFWTIEDENTGTVMKFYDTETKEYSFFLKTYLTDGQGPGSEETFTDGGGTYTLKKLENYKEPEREFVYGENSPVYYDYVRLDEKYQTVDDIKNAAKLVYSEDYLESIYTIMFDGMSIEGNIIYARYMHDESGETDLLLESNVFNPYFETQTTYDYSTMTIVNPSNSSSVNVKIEATGQHIDYDSLEKTVGTYTRTLRFVLGENGWRLDTPTY